MNQTPPVRPPAAPSPWRPSLFSRAVTRCPDNDRDDKGPLGLKTLYEAAPDQAVAADIIFVHGINGGSQSTWTKGGQPSHFWPREWLPRDRAFRDARTHTFGYASGVRDTSILDISDFANRLLSEIHDSPVISHGSKSGIVFVAHSMGGLVVKQAVILGHQHAEFQPIVDRIVSILFLATPHYGAAIARAASKLVSFMPGDRPFLSNLKPDSPMLRGINEVFPRHCEKIKLVSFYETRPLVMGVNGSIIVNKKSAVMNLPNERRTYLDADHRNVAMYSSRSDPSYVAVRNALATILYGCRSMMPAATQSMDAEDQEAVDRFLGVISGPDDDMMMQQSLRFPGSCEWAMENRFYKAWLQSQDCRFLWFRGQPGAGKSVLASRIIGDLTERGLDTSFFFFQSGDKTKSTVNAWLRSTAWQMARLHPDVLAKLKQVMADMKHVPVDKVDYNPVWRKVFLSGILKARLDKPQCWVIDALDECRESTELLTLLARIPNHWPVSVLVTCRDPVEAHGARNALDIQSYTISEDDTSKDIALYLQTNIPRTAMVLWSSPEDIVSQIVERSRGCFLWAKVVCDELQKVTSNNEVTKVLKGIPADMDSLYSKILDDLDNKDYGKYQAKAFITWTHYAFRPLTTDELQEPVEMEMNDNIGDIGTAIARCCGNLVHVDNQGRVRLMHPTTREYLNKVSGQSEFVLSKSAGHQHLAMACLQYLMDMDKTATRFRRPGPTGEARPSISSRHSSSLIVKESSFPKGASTGAFASYASKYLFQHLNQISSKENDILKELAKFLGSTACLRWIEHLASRDSLNTIYQAGKTINSLLSRRAQHSPLASLAHGQQKLALLDSWGDDLIHLVTKFSHRLRQSPNSIHHLIPPFCPTESAIRQQFAKPHRGLAVQGLSNRHWDDCLATITYASELRPNLIVSGPGFFAVGTINLHGRIMVYDDSIFQEVHVMHHGEPVWKMAFSGTANLLASAGTKRVRIWSTATGEELVSFRIPHRCMALTFGEEDRVLRVATAQNELLEWDLTQQAFYSEEPTTWSDYLEEHLQGRQPMILDFSPWKELLCVAYRGQKLLVWDYMQDTIDMYEKGSGSPQLRGVEPSEQMPSHVGAIAMSRGVDTSLVAVTYADGDLVVYDLNTGEQLAEADNMNTMLIVSSNDGRTLAGADSQGTVTLFEFETLRVLYRVQFSKPMIPRTMVFTADNLKLVEIRGKQCRVWEPAVLLRTDTADDEKSDTLSVSSGPTVVDYQVNTAAHITALTSSRTTGLIFYGTSDGAVYFHAGSTEKAAGSVLLFVQSQSCGISNLDIDETQSVLLCVDQASRITAHKFSMLRRAGTATVNVDDLLVNIQPPGQHVLTQVLFSEKESRLLACSDAQDRLLKVSQPPVHAIQSIQSSQWTKLIQLTKQCDGEWLAHMDGNRGIHWLPHPTKLECLVHASPTSFDLYRWSDLSLVQSINVAPGIATDSLATLHHNEYFATVSKQPAEGDTLAHNSVQLWNFDCLNTDTEEEPVAPVEPARQPGREAARAEMPLGVFGHRAVFYTQDNWVASMALGTLPEDAFVRHFFIPNDWVGDRVHPLMAVGLQGEIYFARNSELATIKRGLEVTETGAPFNPRRQRQSNVFGKDVPFRSRAQGEPHRTPNGASPPASSYLQSSRE